MFARRLQLVCSVLAIFSVHSTYAQATSVATENGIVSAAGGPEATQSVSYSIEGEGIAAATTSIYQPASSTGTAGGTVMDGTESHLTNGHEHVLTAADIIGITMAVILSTVCVIGITFVIYRRKKIDHIRAKRKSIMDAEFAPSSSNLVQMTSAPSTSKSSMDKSKNIGYFDIAKPLPAVTTTTSPEEDTNRLSRSSTIIADAAAEMAQINRKDSSHHRSEARRKQSRESRREKQPPLRVAVVDEDIRASMIAARSPLTSNPTTPIGTFPSPLLPAECADGDGDAFAKRISKF